MNLTQKLFLQWTLIGFAFGAAFGFCIGKASAADLAVPPPAKPPERCLITGENPDPGQTLHVDKRCKSGLRWVYQR